MLRVMGFIFGLICLVIGGGTMVTSGSVRLMCRTNCWINDLLFVAFGDQGGKLVLGALWICGALWFLYKTLFAWGRKAKSSEEKP